MLTPARPGPFSLAIGDCNEPHQQQDPDAPKEPEGRKEEIDRDQGEKTPGNKGHAAASVRINCPSRRLNYGNDEQAADPFANLPEKSLRARPVLDPGGTQKLL